MRSPDSKIHIEYLESTFETASEGLFTVSADGHFLKTNPAFEKLLGYKKGKLKGKPFAKIIYASKNAQKIISRTKMHHLQRASEFPLKIELTDNVGNALPVILKSIFKKDKKNEVSEIIGIVETLRNDIRASILEQKVWETQETLHNVLANSGDAIMVADTNGCISIANEALLQMLGYKEDELIGKHIVELSPYEGRFTTTIGEKFFITKEYRNYQTKKAEELFEKGNVSNVEIYFIHKDRTLIPVEATLSTLKDQEGKIRGSISICRDITERMKAEKEIRESRDFLENVLKTSADGIIITDPESYIIFANETIERILGYDSGELIGKHPEEFSPKGKKYREKIHGFVSELLKEDKATGFEYTWVRKDGSLVDIEMSATLLKDSEGNIVGSVGNIRDITERKKADFKISESKEFLENIFKTSADGIIITDAKGLVTMTNEAIERMLGYSKDELIGMHSEKFAVKENKNNSNRKLKSSQKTLLQKGVITRVECAWLKKDGKQIEIENNTALLKDRKGKITGAVAIIRDITESKEMERAFIQAEKLGALGELAGGVAHDFNNILAAILGRVQLLKMQVGVSPERTEGRKSVIALQEGLEIIEKASLDGAETVRRIQKFSKKADSEYFTSIDLNEVIYDALEFTKVRWKDEAELKGIAITIKQIFSALPPVSGNAPELRELFTNLFGNAVDAMPQGGIIEVHTLVKNNHAMVIVKDTGIGIPENIRKRIFDPFFTTKGFQSTGLGLSVSYGIINRHKGSIQVDSSDGEGTSFTIKIPLSKKGSVIKKEKALSKKYKIARILVVEDNKEVGKLLFDILTDLGYEVKVALDGFEGIKAFKKKKFDLVFTDLGMPKMSGWQLARKLKKLDSKVPIALITGWQINMNKRDLKKSGIDLIITKPFKVNQVLQLVQEGMDIKKKLKKTPPKC